MGKKLLIPLQGNDIAPRFDLASEVLIVTIGEEGRVESEKTLVLPQASAEGLCHLVLTESVNAVVCGGIEEEYYQYLKWKRVEVVDSVIGPGSAAVARYAAGALQAGDILFPR